MPPEFSTFKLNVFVYGTLKPGEANYQAYCAGKVMAQTPAYTWGKLFHLPLDYPAMCQGDRQVNGVLLRFNQPDVLQDLDYLEDFQEQRAGELNQYYRRQVLVFSLESEPLGEAWAYFMSFAKVKKYGGTLVNSGCWRGISSHH